MIYQRTLLSLFLPILLLCTLITAQKPDLVIEIFRHGARGPLNQTFDPNPNYWGENVGQLTPVGMRMHYLLGAALKNHYPELLESYDADTIYVRSTDFNRTIMSGYSHMYGVFGLNGPNFSSIPASSAVPPYSSPLIEEMATSFNTNYALPNNVQIIPIEVLPKTLDYELLSFVACPMALDWSDDNQVDSEALAVFQNDMNDIVNYLQGQNLKIETFKDLFFAGDNAISNMVQQIELPGNVSPDSQHYKDFKFAFEWFTTKSVYGTQSQISLYSLDLLNSISDYMNAAANGTSPLNFVFLSAHDTTLMALLAAFNITTKDCLLANYRSDKAGQPIPYPNCTYPKFASDLIFEFYNTDEPYIVFYYDGLPVPLCGRTDNRCTLAEFQAYIKQVTNGYTQQDYLEMCQFPMTLLDNDRREYKVIIIVLAAVCSLIVVSLAILVIKLIKKSEELKRKEQLLLVQPPQEMEEIMDKEI